MRNLRMPTGCFGDHCAAIAVTDEHHGRAERAEHIGDVLGIAVQIGEGSCGGAVPGKVDRVGRNAEVVECVLQAGPAPGTVPGAVHQHDGE